MITNLFLKFLKCFCFKMWLCFDRTCCSIMVFASLNCFLFQSMAITSSLNYIPSSGKYAGWTYSMNINYVFTRSISNIIINGQKTILRVKRDLLNCVHNVVITLLLLTCSTIRMCIDDHALTCLLSKKCVSRILLDT